jgi:uncharacterized RDD family membrane protein YckC
MRRALAVVVDSYVVSFLYAGFLAVGLFGASLGAQAAGARYLSHDLGTALLGPFLWLWGALWWVYVVLFARYGGQTPGKMLLRIRIIDIDGRGSSWPQALLRPVGYVISWLPAGLGFLWAAVPPEKRALHDRLLGTRVVLVPRVVSRVAGRGLAMTWIILCALLSSAAPASALVVDRILAIANGRLITQSDLVAYQTVVGPPGVSRDEATRALIDRQLLLEEADRFAIPDASPSDIALKIREIQAGLNGPDQLAEQLTRLGWEPEDLRQWVGEDLRVADFLDQRVYFFVLVPPQDIDAYYEAHREEFSGLSPEDARAAINKHLTAERGKEKRDQFLEKLRAKGAIRINAPE